MTIAIAKGQTEKVVALLADVCKTFLYHSIPPADIAKIASHLQTLATHPGTLYASVRLETFPELSRTRFTIDIDLAQNSPVKQ